MISSFLTHFTPLLSFPLLVFIRCYSPYTLLLTILRARPQMATYDYATGSPSSSYDVKMRERSLFSIASRTSVAYEVAEG